MRKFLRNWGALTVAIIAVVASVCALYFDNENLKLQKASDQQLDEQHKQAVVKQEERNQQLDGQFEMSMELAREALEADTEHYDELKKYYDELKKYYDELVIHVKYEELSDRISILDNRLQLHRGWLSALPYVYREVAEPYYLEAMSNFYRAEKELGARNFDLAEELIEATYASLAEGYEAYKEATAAVE